MKNRTLFRVIVAFIALVPAAALVTVALRTTLPQQTAPESRFSLPSLDEEGKTIAFPPQGAKEGAVIVSVFASWCGMCEVEHPLLLELKKKYNLPMYGIAWRDDPKDSRGWLAKRGNPYIATGYDRTGKESQSLGITGTPETLVMDARGEILYRQRGPLNADIAKNMIAPLLASR